MKNGSLFHVSTLYNTPNPENADHLFIARSIYQQAIFQDAIYLEGNSPKTSGTPVLSPALSPNRLKNWYFFNFSGPSYARKLGISRFLGFGTEPLSSNSIKQLIFNKSGATRPKKNVQFFSPSPGISEFGGLYIPGFAHAEARPLNWDEKEKVKEALTAGREYFLTRLDNHDNKTVMELLKAFTFFKQRQRTSMVWLLAGSPEKIQELQPLLSTYKWKNETVVLPIPALQEWITWVGAAYAFVDFPVIRGWHIPVHDALACGVPCILSEDLGHLAGDGGALYAKSDSAAIAETLKQIFKDENLRSFLVQRSQIISQSYSVEKTAQLLAGALN